MLVALGGPTLVVAAKRVSDFGSAVGGGYIFNWVAMWCVTLLTVLILVAGERQPLSAIGFCRFTWGSLGFGVALGAVVIMAFPLASLILKALNIPNPKTALAKVAGRGVRLPNVRGGVVQAGVSFAPESRMACAPKSELRSSDRIA